ncbi:alpha/beta hydrolase [Actinoplanes sp. TBRC 11911]|uniref:alpha/beta fold hydrolase n=1 Tax=Actinoplanes sp. TBRC 11911 TaxID=2729386 RepID=UPI00145F4665|nr:alpha/beta hydrolase [Actinoplanes sp. TBRC 11911]NMO55612.1 alpha/beta hydrolase [Actinoplanes sp. TBRC 11911]
MADFESFDGTRLAYRRIGSGTPVLCLPGGPMQASGYLGDLGGLSAERELIVLDLRGTGDSAIPEDKATYRVDRQVDDVEAFRAHLGMDRVDLLAHSAGAALALLYATRHPNRVARLALINPSPRVVALDITDDDRREIAELRRGEPWFPAAFAALERLWADEGKPGDGAAIQPFNYGRRNDDDPVRRNQEAAAAYYGEGGIDPASVRAELSRLPVPVLLTSGEYDIQIPPKRAADYAALFPQARLAVLEESGHFPWLDDPRWLVATVTDFLTRTRRSL